jgi:hypothetical protein
VRTMKTLSWESCSRKARWEGESAAARPQKVPVRRAVSRAGQRCARVALEGRAGGGGASGVCQAEAQPSVREGEGEGLDERVSGS